MAAINLLKKTVIGAIVILSSIVISYTSARAEDYALGQAYLHSFNNGVSVYTGVFALNKDFTLDTSVNFKYTIDVINPSFGGIGEGVGESGSNTERRDDSVSSVAAVSSASGSSSSGAGATDTRNELTAGISHNFNNVAAVELYYDFSHEKDYTSNTPTLSIKKDLFDKNTTLTAGYSRNIDSIKGQYMDSSEDRNTDNYFIGLTQVLTPFTVAQIGYSKNDSHGYEAEGIRLVPIAGVSAGTCTAKSATCVVESFPNKRIRNAFLFGVNHYLKDGYFSLMDKAAIKFNLRYYQDDWDIRSYTGEIEYDKYLSNQLIMRLNYRYYTQTQASFYKDTYTGSEMYKTSSQQLARLNSNLGGIKLIYKLAEDKSVNPGFRAAAIEGKYEYYTENIGVNAHVLMAGIRFLF